MLGYAVFLRTMASLLQASLLTLSAEGKVRRELRRGTDVIAIHGDSVFAVAMAHDLIEAGQVVAISDPETCVPSESRVWWTPRSSTSPSRRPTR